MQIGDHIVVSPPPSRPRHARERGGAIPDLVLRFNVEAGRDPVASMTNVRRRALREQYGPLIEEGMRMLDTALQLDPHYSDAMAYMNLLYRMKANVSESSAESTDAGAKADEWVEKAIAAKRLQPASSPVASMGFAPPPPPPPPPPPLSDTALASEAPMPPRPGGQQGSGTFWQVMGAGDTPAKLLIAQLKSRANAPIPCWRASRFKHMLRRRAPAQDARKSR